MDVGKNYELSEAIKEITIPCSFTAYHYQLVLGRVFVVDEQVTRAQALTLKKPDDFDSLFVRIKGETDQNTSWSYVVFNED
jgi:hypothetical protein